MNERLEQLELEPLPPGTVAPDFTLAQTPRTRLALHSLRGRALVLVFYPLDWEPVSQDQLALYQDYADEFARLGARVLGISVDHAQCHEAFVQHTHIHFPLLADFQPRGAIAQAYGVFRECLGVSARALFVLDPGGVIRWSEVYPDLLNPGVGDLLSTLEAMAASGDTLAAAE